MSKQLTVSVLTQVLSVLCFIAGITVQSKALLLVPVLLVPLAIVSYYFSDDEIKSKSMFKKALFGILLWLYLGTMMTLSRLIGVLVLVSLVITFLLRNKRIDSKRVGTSF